MPDASSLSGLYPQPPALGGQKALDPASLLGLATGIVQNQRAIQELQGRQAVGRAYQGALGSGGLDIQGLTDRLKNDPAAAFVLPEVAGHVLSQRAQQLDTDLKTSQWIADQLGSLADKKNVS